MAARVTMLRRLEGRNVLYHVGVLEAAEDGHLLLDLPHHPRLLQVLEQQDLGHDAVLADRVAHQHRLAR